MVEIVKTDIFSKWLTSIRDVKVQAVIASRLARMADGNLGDCKVIGEGVSDAYSLRSRVSPLFYSARQSNHHHARRWR
jgi:putative addiction module killer protein